MKLTNLFKSNKEEQKAVNVSKVDLMTIDNNSLFLWNGNVYDSDIVRSVLRVKAKAISKTVAKHVRKDVNGLKINPEAYLKFLLEEPNQLMSMQSLLEKVVIQLELNNNAFLFIQRDEYGYPVQLLPINCTSVNALKSVTGELYLKFTLKKGKQVTLKYSDVLHLRQDFNTDDLFGDSNNQALSSLMTVVDTLDKGIISAVKNSNLIQWLLKFNSNLKPEDVKKQTRQFIEDFMSADSDIVGAAGLNSSIDATRVEPKSIMPNSEQMQETTKRIYSFFNVNEKIITSSYNENEWIAFYEACIEPIIIQLSNEFTRKLFTRKERSFGNKIVFEANNLAFASMATKLNLVGFVDRGIMNPNEVRELLNLAPVEHGDEYIRRLDTDTVQDKPSGEGGENS